MQINEFHIFKTRIHDDNHKNVFFACRTRTEQGTQEHIFNFQKKHLKYSPKFYSKAAYDLKRELTKHPLFQLSNMIYEYNETRGNGTKWSCQNQIKSNQIKIKIKSNQIKSNQKSNPKQDFKLKPVSNAFSGYL